MQRNSFIQVCSPSMADLYGNNNFCACSYQFSPIKKTLKALQNSAKTSLRIDENGLLSLQFLSSSISPRGGAVDSILDFKVSAVLLS